MKYTNYFIILLLNLYFSIAWAMPVSDVQKRSGNPLTTKNSIKTKHSSNICNHRSTQPKRSMLMQASPLW